jgi:hypothetical protein
MKYRVQRIDHTDTHYEADPRVRYAWAPTFSDATKQAMGEPHGRHHLWARVWCLELGKAWYLDGIGRVVVEQNIWPRWGY